MACDVSPVAMFLFCVVHPCNLSLDLFCPASSAQLLCNPHDTAALVTLPHLPSFLSSGSIGTIFYVLFYIGRCTKIRQSIWNILFSVMDIVAYDCQMDPVQVEDT